VQYSEHTHYHLNKEKSDFPHIQGLTMQILVQMRGLLCGQRRIWRLRAARIEEKKRLRARRAPVGRKTHAPESKVREEKSGWISLQFLVNWLSSRSAEAGL
jgi:hypothetical protein